MEALWLALPVILGGICHILVIKLNLLPGLARIPLDLGFQFRGKPVFGDNKTLRGVIAMVGATAVAAAVQSIVSDTWQWADALVLVPFAEEHPVSWGMVLGAGYILGELPNSFAKRQLGILPGKPVRGRWRPLFWFLDQMDSFFGIALIMCLVWIPPLWLLLQLALITLIAHPSLTLLTGRNRRLKASLPG